MSSRNLKETVSSNIFIWFLGLLTVGFSSGVGVMLLLQDFTGVVMISRLEQAELTASVEDGKTRIEELEKQNATLASKLEKNVKLQTTYDSALSENKTLTNQTKDLEAQIMFLKKQISEAQEQAKQLKSEASQSLGRQQKITSLTEVNQQLKSSNDTLKHETAILKSSIHELNKKLRYITHPQDNHPPIVVYESHKIRENELREYFDGRVTLAAIGIYSSFAAIKISTKPKPVDASVGDTITAVINEKTYQFRMDKLDSRNDEIYVSVLLYQK